MSSLQLQHLPSAVPSTVTQSKKQLIQALKLCIKAQDLARGKMLHVAAVETGDDKGIYIASMLVDMYAKCGSMNDARLVFDGMPCRDTVTWATLILGYAANGEGEVALEIFSQMERECVMNSFVFVAALKACSALVAGADKKDPKDVKVEALQKGMAIQCKAYVANCHLDVFVGNALVAMYSSCSSMVCAAAVFQRMEMLDRVSWNALILGYAENGEGDIALELLSRFISSGLVEPDSYSFIAALKSCSALAAAEEGMQVDGKVVKVRTLQKGLAIHYRAVKHGCAWEGFVANTLVDMYAKCGVLTEAVRVFNQMTHRDAVCWNALIFGYVDNGEAQAALDLFYKMHGVCRASKLTYVAALKACGLLGALDAGKQLHKEICTHRLQDDVVVATALIDFYGKCWSMADARQVFDSLATKNLVTWTALLAGYGLHGETDQVVDHFQRMQDSGVRPNRVTFLCILTACCHAGLLDKGKEYFEAMTKAGILPDIEHYTCMIDMLCRANKLEDALQLVKTMPVAPNAVTWTAILGACRKWNNVELGKLAFDSLMRLNGRDGAAYVSMADTYAN